MDGFLPHPYPPPWLRLADSLAAVPGDLGCQTFIKPMKNQHIRSWWRILGCSWGSVGPLLSALGPLLGRSWPLLGCSWPLLGISVLVALSLSWVALGRSWVALGRSWAALGMLLGPFGRFGGALGPLWPLLNFLWPLLDRSWGTRNALKAFSQTALPLSLRASEHLSLQVASTGAAKRRHSVPDPSQHKQKSLG